jgi:hypothetical protein
VRRREGVISKLKDLHVREEGECGCLKGRKEGEEGRKRVMATIVCVYARSQCALAPPSPLDDAQAAGGSVEVVEELCIIGLCQWWVAAGGEGRRSGGGDDRARAGVFPARFRHGV